MKTTDQKTSLVSPFRIDPETKRMLIEKGKQEQRSYTNQIIYLLTKWAKEQEEDKAVK